MTSRHSLRCDPFSFRLVFLHLTTEVLALSNDRVPCVNVTA
jgi:hypothetical protein